MGKLNDILQPWQKRYWDAFQNQNRMISLCSRQIGKSFIGGWCADADCIINRAQWTMVSTGQRSADELLQKCVKIAEYMQGFLRGTKLSFDFTHNASEINFSNGGRIISLPNNPAALRGFSASLLLDEYAFTSNAEEVWQACIPFLTSPQGGAKKLQIISTAGGCSGKFYELWTKSDFYKTKITLLNAVREGLPIDIDELKKTVGDDDIFAQEYLCEFADSDSSLFTWEELRNATIDAFPIGGKVYIGIDIGRTHDLTSIAILRELEGVLFLDRIENLEKKDFAFQEKYIADLFTSTKPSRCCIDSTGIGAMLAENLHKKFGFVKEVKFTNETKNEMFTLTKTNLNKGKLKLANDENILADLHKIRRIVGPSGNLSFSASRDANGHADMATAVALGNLAAKKTAPVFMPIN